MALHKLEITVIDGGKASNSAFGESSANDVTANASGAKKANGSKSTLYSVLNYNQTIKNKFKQSVSPSTAFAVQSGINLAKQVGKSVLDYYVSDIGRANGDSNHQAQVNREIEKVTDVLSVGQGALSGAAVGAAAGPIGAIVGAVVGTASSGISLGFKYAERERDYQQKMFEENTSQAYNLAMANYSVYTGRVR